MDFSNPITDKRKEIQKNKDSENSFKSSLTYLIKNLKNNNMDTRKVSKSMKIFLEREQNVIKLMNEAKYKLKYQQNSGKNLLIIQ
jgi:hypothetical protein